jgi:predicted fused transcriptional regulator/phosphomethylpyrimidine kinase
MWLTLRGSRQEVVTMDKNKADRILQIATMLLAADAGRPASRAAANVAWDRAVSLYRIYEESLKSKDANSEAR